MKKVTILFLLLCVGITANAQNFSFGFKGGYNLAGIQGDNSNGFKMRHGIHLGAVAEFELASNFSIQPELMYSQQGANNNAIFIFSEFPLLEGELEARYNFINLPIMAKYYIVKGLSIELGPQIGFLLSAEQREEGQIIDVKDRIKSIDFGVNFGIAYKFSNGLNFGVRYNAGLSNINDVSGFTDKNRYGVAQLSIGYFLRK
ncbi:porin family protein [uncultured Kordia sp.]|uniref:porin family protein n=1 Tax=uncultured Kordia sp. TaxID=507699 RepID=UPI00262269CE|nr:porin family protein [uncultured Kordia sp.]